MVDCQNECSSLLCKSYYSPLDVFGHFAVMNVYLLSVGFVCPFFHLEGLRCEGFEPIYLYFVIQSFLFNRIPRKYTPH